MSSPVYRVDFGQSVRNEIRILAFRAVRKGLLTALASSLREMEKHLQFDPIGWGDPLYQYRVFGWLLYQRAVNPLHVSYGVDEVRKIVYVKSVRPIPGGGLESVP